MGTYDIFVDGDYNEQVKAYDCMMRIYSPGVRVPDDLGKNATIVCPGMVFVLIKDGKFLKITEDREETYAPYFDKWGGYLESIDDFENPYEKIVAEVAERFNAPESAE